ncbi:hypothetical protein CCR75_001062 [Bremia lactucae]|uniref:Secreted RxLR effector n=1 Tax=Bremia lactucae TaxID=4779 RepID=A0A976IH60_BRELC|nr:hypothetical protein CCR75_001062 [Bremia lactucae]
MPAMTDMLTIMWCLLLLLSVALLTCVKPGSWDATTDATVESQVHRRVRLTTNSSVGQEPGYNEERLPTILKLITNSLPWKASLQGKIAKAIESFNFADPPKHIESLIREVLKASSSNPNNELLQLFNDLKKQMTTSYLIRAGLDFYVSKSEFSNDFGTFLSRIWTAEDNKNLDLTIGDLAALLANIDESFTAHPLCPILVNCLEYKANAKLDRFEEGLINKAQNRKELTSTEEWTDKLLTAQRSSSSFKDVYVKAGLRDPLDKALSTNQVFRLWAALVWRHTSTVPGQKKSFSTFIVNVTSLKKDKLAAINLLSKQELRPYLARPIMKSGSVPLKTDLSENEHLVLINLARVLWKEDMNDDWASGYLLAARLSASAEVTLKFRAILDPTLHDWELLG